MGCLGALVLIAQRSPIVGQCEPTSQWVPLAPSRGAKRAQTQTQRIHPMATNLTVHYEAVQHARAAAKCGALSWNHVRAEWTQDVPSTLATLEPGGPYTWTLPNNKSFPGPDELRFYSATTLEEIEQQ